MNYVIVVDAGSLGLRLHIYQYSLDPTPHMVPLVVVHPEWNKKITPGLSLFGSLEGKKLALLLWENHLLQLVSFTELIIPRDDLPKTPIFIQATAGMRLLSEKQQSRILATMCHLLRDKLPFMISNCRQQLEIIDGETEGIYGWLLLNYLAGRFQNTSDTTLGFMDMGGASTQVAFVPLNSSEVERHRDDLAMVRLRSTEGALHLWPVFVLTWLGFGANQARRRYLESLTALGGKPPILDPCLPAGLKTKETIKDEEVSIEGVGDYDTCLKLQYPLLLKHLPCTDDPCLFNGVHVPMIDFTKDHFVGVSEYWYTINDIFGLGGTYSFSNFNTALKDFCQSNWDNILDNYNNNRYNGIKLDYLKDSCFKGGWVINVLHEGFGVPRLDFEEGEGFYFKSAAQINGSELLWTLGKALLYALLQVPGSKLGHTETMVGISASEAGPHSGRFIAGDFEIGSDGHRKLLTSEKIGKVNSLFVGATVVLLGVVLLGLLVLRLLHKHIAVSKTVNGWVYRLHRLQRRAGDVYDKLFGKGRGYTTLNGENSFETNIALEEGLGTESDARSHLYLSLNQAGFYKNFTAPNSVASLYSQAGIVLSFDNKLTTNLAGQGGELEADLTSPQLRSRVSLFNLANAE